MSLTFRIYRGTQLLREETLAQPVIKIGKVASAHLRLDDDSISRMHAIVEVAAGAVSLIDLGSTRGTFVNGQRINKATLQSGDAITVGELRIEVTVNAPATAPTVASVIAPKLAVVPPPMPVTAVAPPFRPAPAPTPAETFDGAKSIEVAAMLGDSVVDVKHCIDPTTGKVSSKTIGLFAAGAACVLASAVSFASSVHTAARNKDALDYWTHVEKRPAGAFRAEMPGAGYDWVAFGGFAFGIFALARGLSRMRDEKKSPYYRIGTAPGVDMATEQAPAADFALVAPRGDDFVLNVGHGLSAEMIMNGQVTPISAPELPIPAGAKFRVRAGKTTFMVSAVARPRRQAAPLLASLENRTLAYFAGSLAVHLGLWALLQTIPVESGAADIDLGSMEQTDIKGQSPTNEELVQKPDPDNDNGGNDGGKMAIKDPEGQAGTEKSLNHDSSQMKVKQTTDNPQLTREAAIDMAREAGILGNASAIHNGFNIDIDGVTSGFDTSNQAGAIYGADMEGYGHFGLGRSGFGGGGGCTTEPCGTIAGAGYGTIGNGRHAGGEYGLGGNGHGPGMGRHSVTIPQPIISNANGGGGLDKEIIRRYIKRNSSKLQYCFEKQLLAKAGIQGDIQAQFVIMPDGSVKSSTAKGFDSEVASCVGEVIGAIEFPKPSDGGAVQVNYPLTFHAAGQ